MTKEELYKLVESFIYDGGLNYRFHGIIDGLDEFFNSNVVIPKGDNRHPYADVLHEWVEGADIEMMFPNGTRVWSRATYLDSDCEYRIKQKEPVYEALVRINYSDGTYDDTERYFTHEEFEQFGFPKSCEWAIETKRERK